MQIGIEAQVGARALHDGERAAALTACHRIFTTEVARWQKDTSGLGNEARTGSVTFVQRFNATLGCSGRGGRWPPMAAADTRCRPARPARSSGARAVLTPAVPGGCRGWRRAALSPGDPPPLARRDPTNSREPRSFERARVPLCEAGCPSLLLAPPLHRPTRDATPRARCFTSSCASTSRASSGRCGRSAARPFPGTSSRSYGGTCRAASWRTASRGWRAVDAGRRSWWGSRASVAACARRARRGGCAGPRRTSATTSCRRRGYGNGCSRCRARCDASSP